MDNSIIDLINRHLKGESTPRESLRLKQWLEASSENRRFYADFAANWKLHESLTSSTLEQDTERMVSRLNARIDAGAQHPVRRARRSLWTGISVAAVSACLVAGGVFLAHNLSFSQPEHLETVVNQTDDTSTMVLEDGTHVYLRPGATLSYNVQTLKGRRIAELTGDAYFDVARDEAKPFIVRTDNISVQVLGTSFSVSAQPEVSQVVLERGGVRLLSPAGDPLVSLLPNQKAIWRSGGDGVRVESVYAAAFVTDKYNLVAYYDEAVPDILASLEERFHVKLNCSRIPEGKRYNLAFLKSDSLENVIAILEYLAGIECHIDHN